MTMCHHIQANSFWQSRLNVFVKLESVHEIYVWRWSITWNYLVDYGSDTRTPYICRSMSYMVASFQMAAFLWIQFFHVFTDFYINHYFNWLLYALLNFMPKYIESHQEFIMQKFSHLVHGMYPHESFSVRILWYSMYNFQELEVDRERQTGKWIKKLKIGSLCQWTPNQCNSRHGSGRKTIAFATSFSSDPLWLKNCRQY